MTDPHINAAFYLSPTLDSFWRWSEDAQVLASMDNTTIAFHAEVAAVVKHLAPGGLPPFGAVALLLAACRDGWINSAARQAVVGHANVSGGFQTSDVGLRRPRRWWPGTSRGTFNNFLPDLTP